MRASLAIIAFATGLAIAPGSARAQEMSATQSAADALALYNEGRKKLTEGDYTGASTALYESLEKLRAEGRGASADAGLVAGFLANALEKLDHPQTDQAWSLAFNLLERAANPSRFIDAASGLLRRTSMRGSVEEAEKIIARLMQRVDVEGVSDNARIDALNIAMSHYSRSNQKSASDALLMAHGIRLNGETPEALEIRGLARLRRATDAYRDGKLSAFEEEIEAALSDIRRTLPKSARDLGSALTLSAKMRMKEGAYARAILDAEEAATVFQSIKVEDLFQEARIIQIRILERVGRSREALDLARELNARYTANENRDVNFAALLRLLVIEMVAANRRIAEARALLAQERTLLDGLDDKVPLGLFHDRVAELDLLESDFAAAARSAELALETLRVARPDDKAILLEAMRKRASATEGLRDRAYGDRAHRELIELSSILFHDAHPEYARDLDAYAGFLESEGRRLEAYGLRRRSIAALERAYGENGVKVAFALNNLASLLGAIGNSEEAVASLKRAITIMGDAPDYASRRLVMRANLANSLIDLGRTEEAMVQIARARAESSYLGPESEGFLSTVDMVEMLALDAIGRTGDAYRKGEIIVSNAKVTARDEASNLMVIHLRMAQMAQKLGDDNLALKSAGLGANLLTSERIETDTKWRVLAETTLPSLWRLGGN